MISPSGKKIIDFKRHNLHVLNYSASVNKYVNYKELIDHIYTIRELPDAIPYVHSYYDRKWGFSIKYKNYKKLPKKVSIRFMLMQNIITAI